VAQVVEEMVVVLMVLQEHQEQQVLQTQVEEVVEEVYLM